jgi:hypothetical protein
MLRNLGDLTESPLLDVTSGSYVLGVAGVFLHGVSGEQAQQKRHGVETLFAQGQGGIPEAYREQQQAQHRGKSAEAVVDIGNVNAFEAVAHAFLQRNGREQAVHKQREIIALFVKGHLDVPQPDDEGGEAGLKSNPGSGDKDVGGLRLEFMRVEA